MTFDSYLKLLGGNHSLQAEMKSVEAAYYEVLSGVSVQRPKLEVKGTASWLSGQTMMGVKVTDITAGSVSFLLGTRIDVSGVFSLDEKQRILSYETQRAKFCNSLNTLFSSAEEMWWTTVLARENVVLQKDVLRQRSENHRVTLEKFRQQLVPKLDIIRSEALVVAAESKVKEAETIYRNLLAQLSLLAGGVEVVPVEEPLSVPMFDASVITLDKALEFRPDVRAARKIVERARIVKKLMGKGKAPTLDFGMQWTPWSDPDLSSSPQREEAGASLQLNIPILDGNKTKYEVLNANSMLGAAEEGLRATETAARRDVTIAFNNWNQSIALEQDKKRQVERSNEELRITELMYQEGMGAQIDLINAQTANQAVRTDYLNAVKDMYLALVDMRRVIGDYAPSEEGSWKEALVRYGKGHPVDVKSVPAKAPGPSAKETKKK